MLRAIQGQYKGIKKLVFMRLRAIRAIYFKYKYIIIIKIYINIKYTLFALKTKKYPKTLVIKPLSTT